MAKLIEKTTTTFCDKEWIETKEIKEKKNGGFLYVHKIYINGVLNKTYKYNIKKETYDELMAR